MKKLILLLVVLALLIPATAVIASDVDTAEYITNISITNNSTDDKSAVATTLTLSTADMIESDMLNATATDAVMHMTGAVDTAFMPSANSTYPWCVWVPTSDAVSNIYYNLYSGGATGGKIRYFPGPDGMMVTNDASLYIADDFIITITGVFLHDDSDIINKDDDFILRYDSATGNVTAYMGSIFVTATSVPEGEYDIVLVADTVDLILTIDDELPESADLDGQAVTESGDWYFFQGVYYVESIKIRE